MHERFLNKIKKTKSCWIWMGAMTSTGYGNFFISGRNNDRAHKYSYRHYIGKIPSGICVLHKCDNRICVNPKHLFLGTHKDNMVDCSQKGRNYKGGAIKPHRKNKGYSKKCGRGHIRNKKNTSFRKKNGETIRVCKLCVAINNRRSIEQSIAMRKNIGK